MQSFSSNDLRLLAKLPLSVALASLVPVARWDDATDLLIRAAQTLRPASLRKAVALLERHLDPASLEDPLEVVARRFLRNIRIDGLATLRSHDPRGWKVEVSIEGLEHLTAAQARGRGIIVWVAPFVFASLVTKRALHEAGFGLHHLSTATHGSSTRSSFGLRYLRPIRISVEDRYLIERIEIPLSGSMHQPLRRLSKLLNEGAIVSVTLGSMGAQPQRARFLNGGIEVATGVPSLSIRTRAVILPVVTVRTGLTTFATFIGSPLDSGDEAKATRTDRASTVREVASRLAPFALRWPEQVCWHHSLFSSNGGRT